MKCSRDAVTSRRELGRERSKKYRERSRLYGRPGEGYRITQRVLPADVTELLAKRFPAIGAALGDDAELGRLLDSLEAAFAYGALGSFEAGNSLNEENT